MIKIITTIITLFIINTQTFALNCPSIGDINYQNRTWHVPAGWQVVKAHGNKVLRFHSSLWITKYPRAIGGIWTCSYITKNVRNSYLVLKNNSPQSLPRAEANWFPLHARVHHSGIINYACFGDTPSACKLS